MERFEASQYYDVMTDTGYVTIRPQPPEDAVDAIRNAIRDSLPELVLDGQPGEGSYEFSFKTLELEKVGLVEKLAATALMPYKPRLELDPSDPSQPPRWRMPHLRRSR